MKTLGLIGGMSWESSREYYRLINEKIRAELGGLHSAKILMYSVNFEEIEMLRKSGDWAGIAEILIDTAVKLEKAGADYIMICTNTMHKMAGDVQKNIGVPLLHIADAAAEAIIGKSMKKVGLLGTRFTMEQDFYKTRIKEKYGIDVITPPDAEREIIHRTIYEELCRGEIKSASRAEFVKIIERLAGQGAEGVILGCTEIPLLVGQEDSPIPVFDTTALHAEYAVNEALL